MSDERLRQLERTFREEWTDAAETAYWDAFMALGCPAWATPPWHVRCPSILPRAGDQIGSRLVLAVRGEVVRFREIRVQHFVNVRRIPRPRSLGLTGWLAWTRRHPSVCVTLLAGRDVPGLPGTKHGVAVPGVAWPMQMTAWGAARALKRMKKTLRAVLGDRVDEVL